MVINAISTLQVADIAGIIPHVSVIRHRNAMSIVYLCNVLDMMSLTGHHRDIARTSKISWRLNVLTPRMRNGTRNRACAVCVSHVIQNK